MAGNTDLKKYCQSKILELGTIDEILKDRSLLLQLITAQDNGNYIYVFFDMINEALRKGEILPSQLINIRSGWFGTSILHLEDVMKSFDLETSPFEKRDKLASSIIIEDVESQSAIFTNSKVIRVLAGLEQDSGISSCEQYFINLSLETRLRMAEEIMKVGNTKKALEILESITNGMGNERREKEKNNVANRGM